MNRYAADTACTTPDAMTGKGMGQVREALAALAPEHWFAEPRLLGDLLPAGELAVLVVPIDLGAPKGRLILPQVQAIRDILDSDASCMPAPSVRYALGEAFGLAPGSVTTGKMLAALKQLGFSNCWDTEFAADVTIWEEASEFVERLGAKRDLPQFTSCCPGWQKYAETFYPDLLPHFSSCKSPVAMIEQELKKIPSDKVRNKAVEYLAAIESGQRDFRF